jgi:uncharacterized alpha-E superfamily protein
MLCRTANELYWMARHIERAENTARLLDVTYRMALLPYETIEPGLAWAEPWAVPLITSGLATDFYDSFQQLSAENVLRYMILDASNTSSIYCCLRAARESARAVRGAITSEMYEDLNSAWLDMRAYDYNRIQASGVSEFLEWVKMRSHLFRGVTFGTMLRDEAYHFIRLGTHIERGDNTARILDVKYHTLLPSAADVGGARLLPVERAAAVGIGLRVLSQDLQRRDYPAAGGRALDTARRHAAIAAFVHEFHS